MQTEYSARGDPTRMVEHLWNIRELLSRGSKPSLNVDWIVAAAIDGIEALVDMTSRH